MKKEDKEKTQSNISAKKWIRNFILISLVILFTVFTINLVNDPMMLTSFSTPFNQHAKIVNERQQKVNFLTYNDIDYNGVIIGSSRATYLNPNLFDSDKKIYNLSYNGGILPEYKSFLNYFSKKNKQKIKYIYFGIDFFQTVTAYKDYDSADNYIKNTEDNLYRIKTLISDDCLYYALTPNYLTPQYLNREGGYKVTNEKFLDKDKTKKIAEHLDKLYAFKFNPNYDEFLAELKSEYPDAKFIVFTTPEPKTLLNYLMKNKKLYHRYEKWLKETVDVFGEIYHFDYFNEVTLNEEKYFLDTHHLTSDSSNYIIYKLENSDKALDDFGIILNKTNLSEFLKKTKKEFGVNY